MSDVMRNASIMVEADAHVDAARAYLMYADRELDDGMTSEAAVRAASYAQLATAHATVALLLRGL